MCFAILCFDEKVRYRPLIYLLILSEIKRIHESLFPFGSWLTHRSHCTLSLPPENIRKPSGFLLFSGGRERVHWERVG